MIVVIIAGGSGTRLWPLSTPDYPKHLLKLTNDKSLLQNTVERALKVAHKDKVFVMPEESHVAHVYEQLPDMSKDNILVEPDRRGTASCVAWALSEMKKRGYNEEPIVFLWGDQLIHNTDGFVASVLRAGEVSIEQSKIVFMGIEPTYPSTGFGYIHKGTALEGRVGVFALEKFVEKPQAKVAEQYFASGDYLWNIGNLVGTVRTFEEKMESQAPKMWSRYQCLLKAKDPRQAYLGLEAIALEYEFSESMQDALVMTGNFDWVDLGSFKDLHEISAKDEAGNHVLGEDVILERTTNSYVRKENGVPVAVIGLDNIVVVSTKNGVLVANANFVQSVGEVSKRLGKK
jgi:mannose-1-phosphate guanylyltransferase/mannose-6-phosphate isomerase